MNNMFALTRGVNMRGFRRTGVQDRWFHIGFITHDFTHTLSRSALAKHAYIL